MRRSRPAVRHRALARLPRRLRASDEPASGQARPGSASTDGPTRTSRSRPTAIASPRRGWHRPSRHRRLRCRQRRRRPRFGAPVRVNDIAGDASGNGEQPPRVVLQGTHGHGPLGVEAAWRRGDSRRAVDRRRDDVRAGALDLARERRAAAHAAGRSAAIWPTTAPCTPPGSTAATAAPMPAGAPRARGDAAGHLSRDVDGPASRRRSRRRRRTCASAARPASSTRGTDVFVVWRHLFPGGVRDIAVARSTDGGRTFGAPVRVSDDNWKIDACPDDGPSMAIDGRRRAARGLADAAAGRRPAAHGDLRGGQPRRRRHVLAARAGRRRPRARRTRASPSDTAPPRDRVGRGAPRGPPVLFRAAGGGVAAARRCDRCQLSGDRRRADGFVVAWTDQANGVDRPRGAPELLAQHQEVLGRADGIV